MSFAINNYTGNGSTATFSVTFPYITQSHVQVRLDNVLKTLGVDYTFPTSSTIQFTNAPANGVNINFKRSSNQSARLVDFQDGSTITESILDQDSNQMFYMSQEAIDSTAGVMALDGDNKWDAQSRIIKNIASPVNDNDAVNKAFITTNLPAINTVNTNIASVASVASNIANVNAVNSNSANINSVASNSANINSAVSNATNINSVVANSANINTAAGANANITAVAGQITPTNNIGTLAGLTTQITGVYNIRTDVTAVNSNSANISSVASNIGAITAVNSNSANINAVNSNSSNINTIATNIGKVNTLYTEIAKVVEVANDLQEAVSEIDTVANSITNVNNVGNSITAVNTVSSNLAGINSFNERYRISATAPTTSLDIGDLWYDSASSNLRVYTANGWQIASDYIQNLVNDYKYDITGSPSYVEGASNNANAAVFDYAENSLVNVFVNGLRIIPTEDYTLSKNNNVARVTFVSPLINGDVVYIQVFRKLQTVEEQTLQSYVSTTLGYKNTTEGFKNTTEGYKNSAQTSATNSANSATASANSATASQNSATASASSAASSLQSLNSFNAAYTYSTTPPNNPANGAIWFDTATTRLKVYVSQNNTGWVNVGTYVEGLITNYTYTATQGQTVFNGADVDNKTLAFNATGNVFVFVNGIRITPTADYVLSAGNTCTLGVAANSGDVIYIEVIQKISLTEEQLLQSYVASALADKNTATTQAGIATTQAGIATTQATNASSSASSALTSKNNAATSEANALSYRNTTEGYKNDAQTAKTAAEAAAALATVGGGAFKITANDTTANVFNLKVSVGNGITKTLNNAGGNESVTLSLPFTETVITPTNGQTVFNTAYVVNFVQVYVNGVKLIKGVDFTATDGTTITLNDALLSNDVVEIVKFA